MFDIKPKNDVDSKLFVQKYIDSRKELGILIGVSKMGDKIDEEIRKISYEDAYRLLDFLYLCLPNYTVMSLILPLEQYCHEKEDELILDLYMAYQNGKVSSWLDSRSLSEISMLKKCIQNDDSFKIIFSDLYSCVFEKDEVKHI